MIFVLLPALLLGCTATLGGKQRDELLQSVIKVQPYLEQCYAEALKRNRDLEGRVDVVLHVPAKQTKVDSARVASSTANDAELHACIEKQLADAVVMEGPATNVEAHYVLELQRVEAVPTETAPAPGS